MIWLKRALPLFVLAAAWFGYVFIRDTLQARHAAEDTRHALLTAEVWVASALDRANPQTFIAYRDSLLKANNMSTEQMFQYLKTYEKDPSRQLSFSRQVSKYVDSLVKLRFPSKGYYPAASEMPEVTRPTVAPSKPLVKPAPSPSVRPLDTAGGK